MRIRKSSPPPLRLWPITLALLLLAAAVVLSTWYQERCWRHALQQLEAPAPAAPGFEAPRGIRGE